MWALRQWGNPAGVLAGAGYPRCGKENIPPFRQPPANAKHGSAIADAALSKHGAVLAVSRSHPGQQDPAAGCKAQTWLALTSIRRDAPAGRLDGRC